MNNHQWRYCPVALALMATLWPQSGWSESYFNPAFCPTIPPAWRIYRVLNKVTSRHPACIAWISGVTMSLSRPDVRFEQADDTPPVAGGLAPCITRKMLERFGVNLAAFPELVKVQDDTCVPLATAIPGSGRI